MICVNENHVSLNSHKRLLDITTKVRIKEQHDFTCVLQEKVSELGFLRLEE